MSSEEDVAEILITEIQSRPALWNTRLLSYKNKHLRDKLYAEVGQILGISKETVAARWKNKKDHYRRELKKFPISRSGDGANNILSTWPYFQLMSFLKDLMTPATKYGNLSSSQQNDNIDDEVEEGSETQSSLDPASPAPELLSESSTSQPVTRTPSVSSSTITKANRKRLCDTREDRFLELENKKLQMLSQTLVKEAPVPESDDLNFFKSLIPYMETLTPLRKLVIRNKIQQIIIDEMSQNEACGFVPQNNVVQQNNLTQQQLLQEDTRLPQPPFSQYSRQYLHL